jgi:hypothetical protein
MKQNLPHALRLGTSLICMACAFMLLISYWQKWWGWLAALAIILISGKLGETLFRRTASADTIRADLEDRVRNPPS